MRVLIQSIISFIKKKTVQRPSSMRSCALIVTICIGIITTVGSNGNGLSSNAPATVDLTGGN